MASPCVSGRGGGLDVAGGSCEGEMTHGDGGGGKAGDDPCIRPSLRQVDVKFFIVLNCVIVNDANINLRTTRLGGERSGDQADVVVWCRGIVLW